MSGLNVVCLISGGKDSLFSILHCIENGHKIIALANLHPPKTQGTVEDMDSYMYQTIGHAVLPLYEKALGLPLFRHEIHGAAVNRDKCYGVTNGMVRRDDETEALIPLLASLRRHHPEINAISTGAILSDYQRTRVESVAIRLGLTPLSYLWQWPHLPPQTPTSLLEDMAATGQDSRIVKVASGGLDESLLWHNVADRRTINRLVKIAQRFGTIEDGAVLGEGGEYETLAIAGPPPLWKGRIVVEESDQSVIPGEAGVSSVKIEQARFVPQMEPQIPQANLRIPALLDDDFERMFQSLANPVAQLADVAAASTRNIRTQAPRAAMDHALISNITGEGGNAVEQMRSVMEQLRTSLLALEHQPRDVAYTSIILRDMVDFPAMNTVYSRYFQHPNPPARITIACAKVLPHGRDVMLSATSVKTPDALDRKGLHVQSRSYWAPANIGPYSQAISVPIDNRGEDVRPSRLVYIAGQIPLVPASMELPSSADLDKLLRSDSIHARTQELFRLQAVLSMQHFWRIGQATEVSSWGPMLAFIVASSDEDAAWKAQIAHRAWQVFYESLAGRGVTEEEEDEASDGFDVWHLKHGSARSYAVPAASNPSSYSTGLPPAEPLRVIRVDSLPRGSSIEWVTYGITGVVESAVEIGHYRHLLDVFGDSIVPWV